MHVQDTSQINQDRLENILKSKGQYIYAEDQTGIEQARLIQIVQLLNLTIILVVKIIYRTM